MPNAITLISEYAPQRCRSLAINTMYCGFPLGAAGGGAISSWLIPNYGWHSVLLLGAIAPLVLTVLLILLLPESVKYMVNRGQDAAKIKRIAQRFVSQSLDGVTRFYLYEEKLAQTKTSVGLLFSRPYLLGTLMLWLTYFMGLVIYYVFAELDANPDAGIGLSVGAIGDAHLAVHLWRHARHPVAGWLMDRWNAHKVVSSGFVVTAC